MSKKTKTPNRGEYLLTYLIAAIIIIIVVGNIAVSLFLDLLY